MTQFNPNVTGINIEHSYVNAALYAGFVAVAIMSVFIRDIKDKRLLTAVFLVMGAVLPAACNYFLHEEPTASLLSSVCTAAILMAVLGPVLYQKMVEGHENLVILPALMTGFALMTHELIAKGNASTTHEKVIALGVLAAVTIGGAVVSHFAFKNQRGSFQQAA